ncbi:alcohol dehydrogenase catalytic domain-containing protein [Deinococcus malanensis]|uniref:alcohol dehydrogenase catalytic domain-containing protein n=1 Tax=Deinococcus malanensis TaxID=1706855 RepID=UPI00362E40D1
MPTPGWVLIRVRAFGLNQSELHLRLGVAENAAIPIIPGIKAVGVVTDCPGGEFQVGHQVATMMGGIGRQLDGGYAEYTCVPAGQVIPFRSDLNWATLGASAAHPIRVSGSGAPEPGGPIRVIRHSSMRGSAGNAGVPVPSTIIPPLMTKAPMVSPSRVQCASKEPPVDCHQKAGQQHSASRRLMTPQLELLLDSERDKTGSQWPHDLSGIRTSSYPWPCGFAALHEVVRRVDLPLLGGCDVGTAAEIYRSLAHEEASSS